jgi:hypothetical protein
LAQTSTGTSPLTAEVCTPHAPPCSFLPGPIATNTPSYPLPRTAKGRTSD